MTITHGMQAERLSKMQRLWRKLGFGARRAPEFPLYQRQRMAAGELTTLTTVHLDWRDRLRLILSGSMLVEARSITDVPVRSVLTNSAVGILPPF